ncbi:hypothetical protein HY637_02370 [Candidatus Woesearchaeota archaeon]|nr:hypothetical protein [Candidatus Woesearchaeota archaeon]
MSGTQLIAESLIEVIVKDRRLTVNTLRALRDYVEDESIPPTCYADEASR